jgi:hypothetical protein
VDFAGNGKSETGRGREDAGDWEWGCVIMAVLAW